MFSVQIKQHQRVKGLFQSQNHSMFQSVKHELKTFRKINPVFQAILVLLPAFRVQKLGYFDLGPQQKCQTKSH